MDTQKRLFWIAIPLIAVFWFNPANASSVSVTGVTVDAAGSSNTVGITTAGGKIKYYIPLDETTSGVYGEDSSACSKGIGTCYDIGGGFGYNDATALDMNIYFDLTLQPQSVAAELNFVFDDLDLIGINDPNQFFESMSLSYWNGASFTPVNPIVKYPSDIVVGIADINATDPITWNLDLDLAALAILNDSNGFWIQFGFGSKYDWTGRNTPEYLTAALTLSPVPLPAASWLFGTALIAFVGFARRRSV